MKIEISNRQQTYHLQKTRIKHLIEWLLGAMRPLCPHQRIEHMVVVVTCDTLIKELHAACFMSPTVTDVMSMHYAPIPGDTHTGASAELIVNVERAWRVAL